ncbi:hypothetical protein [Alicyclobacillus acidiphilus]|jgi:hypothetical protein|uniref:hypothetical protein n=1 Tax=Alicyclobacillus acidiphilus TaxID=182455 RepID=UPI0008303BEF|nr:hypothetical protein [Alicyclobacillus acidiphilus]
MNVDRLNKRLRAITISWWVFMGLTALCLIILSGLRVVLSGLLLGEVGGLFVVVSMIRQGHHNDDTQGTALFASGMLGMFLRLIAIVLIMVISLKFKALFNPYTALVGYLLGFAFVFAGLYSYARNPSDNSTEK